MPVSMTVVTPSYWLAERVEKSILAKYPVKVINNGVDAEIFKPRQSDFRARNGLADKKLVLAVAAIWGKRKGFDDVLKLAERLGDGYRVIMVGLTTEQKKLPKGIVGIPRTNDPVELAEIYAASDVFISTTYEDNFPTVNMEAQVCGTPVITYRTGGSPESVPPENVVPRGDVAALAEAVKRITGDTAAAVKPITTCKISEAYLNEYSAVCKRADN